MSVQASHKNAFSVMPDTKSKKYPAAAIANAFLEVAKNKGDAVSPMKLLKLVYYAHGWHLALEDEPLLNESIEAWRHGPVVASLWGRMKKYSGGAVDEPVGGGMFSDPPSIEEDDEFVQELIDQVWDAYGDFGAVKLSNLTHMPGTPWYQTKEECGGDLPRRKDIDNEKIRDYFKQLL